MGRVWWKNFVTNFFGEPELLQCAVVCCPINHIKLGSAPTEIVFEAPPSEHCWVSSSLPEVGCIVLAIRRAILLDRIMLMRRTLLTLRKCSLVVGWNDRGTASLGRAVAAMMVGVSRRSKFVRLKSSRVVGVEICRRRSGWVGTRTNRRWLL
jgi:hypothetical protein